MRWAGAETTSPVLRTGIWSRLRHGTDAQAPAIASELILCRGPIPQQHTRTGRYAPAAGIPGPAIPQACNRRSA